MVSPPLPSSPRLLLGRSIRPGSTVRNTYGIRFHPSAGNCGTNGTNQPPLAETIIRYTYRIGPNQSSGERKIPTIMRRRPLAPGSLSVVVFGIFGASTGAGAFVPSANSALCRHNKDKNPGFVGNVLAPSSALLLGMMHDSRGDSSDSSPGRKKYSAADLERLREAARCPEAFERLSLNMKSEPGDGSDDEGGKSEELAPTNKTKGGYQRIEEWDAEQKSSVSMTWDEKCIHDAMRHGNQVRQNDILIRNMHSW